MGNRDCCPQSEHVDRQLYFQTSLPTPHSPPPTPLIEAETFTGIHVHEWAFLPSDKLVFSPELLE
jgi:hypothetical protein